jgi:NAD(P)-dependent dehydrogenase (short-subunit alcohol dehydrogenase family)
MMARGLALNGAHKVYIIGRRQDVLQKAAESVPTGNIIPLVGDVTSKESLSSVVQSIEKDVGYINVLIANSGISGQPAKISPQMSIEDFQKEMWSADFAAYLNTFAVNTAAAWYTVIAFLALLDRGNKKGNVKQKSQVIATSSIASFNRVVLSGYSYGQSKAALTHMMKQLATGLAPYGIRANVLCPGCECPCVSKEDTIPHKHDRTNIPNSLPLRHGKSISGQDRLH